MSLADIAPLIESDARARVNAATFIGKTTEMPC